MVQVALTGGIGSGKSTVAALLRDRGAVVIDSDQLAREVVQPGTSGLAAIAERFGAGVLAADGSLDRPALASIVFTDPAARRDLEGITHPAVRRRFAELAAAAPAGSIVVNDIPLLTSLDGAAAFHLVVTVGVETGTRVTRLISRGHSETDARARIAAQIDDEARDRLTDIWIDNNGAPADLAPQIDALWERLTGFQANLSTGRRAPRPGPDLVAADPRWALDAARLLARTARAAGDRALSLDHIGSTAVPGLPAKDVLDLQLGVADLAVADDLADDLAAVGFVPVDGVAQDHPHPADADPTAWTKRFHANADPGRAVNLHVRVDHGPGWRFALSFRDWLRADSAVRAEYLAEKQSLAERFADDPTSVRYAEAKEAWFAAAAPRLAEWVAGGNAG